MSAAAAEPAQREDPAALGAEMHALATELFPINRSLTGPGNRATIDRLEAVCGPLARHRFPTREQVFDWTIPSEWTLREAWIRGPGGEIVVSTRQSTLHVVGYSIPFRGRMPLAELQEHLHSLPAQPDAIPYRTTYYRPDWGFCLTERQRGALPDGEYEVCVDADLAPGAVEVAELVVEGDSDKEVLFWTYCCHPSMANNELSGPVLVAHLARLVRERRPRLTYRFVFGPETIGAIAYLARMGEHLRRSLVAGWVITCAGDPGAFTYKRSRRGATLADRAAEHALAHAADGHRALDFFATGSDERQFCSPGFDLPVGSIMRSMYGTYPEYHTSLDDLSLITPEALGQSLALLDRVVDALEANVTYTATMPFCEPHLGARGLYPTTGGAGLREQRLHDTMHLLNFCDGSGDLLAAAERSGRPVWELAPVAELLREHRLLEMLPAR